MTIMTQRIVRAFKNGKAIHASTTAGQTAPLFEFHSLADTGLVRIIRCGQENVYFEWTDDEGFKQNGFCKCL